MVRFRTRIHAKIPEPNDNVTMTLGHKVIVDAVFRDTGLDDFLDSLKRDQGTVWLPRRQPLLPIRSR